MSNEVAQIMTPKGMLEWVTITGEGKANLSGKLQYTANLVIDPLNIPEHAEVIKGIEKFWDENKPKGFKRKPKSIGVYLHDLIKDEAGEAVLDDDGKKQYKEDGLRYLAFKTGTTYKKGDPKIIKTFNAKGARVALGEKKIGNGSIGRISGAMGIYVNKDPKGNIIDAGVSLYLDSIQITKLVEFTGSEPQFAPDDIDEESFMGVDDSFEGNAASEAAQPRL